MTDNNTRNDTPSVAEGIRPVTTGGPVIAAHFLGDTACFVLGEEALVLSRAGASEKRVDAHGGAIE